MYDCSCDFSQLTINEFFLACIFLSLLNHYITWHLNVRKKNIYGIPERDCLVVCRSV